MANSSPYMSGDPPGSTSHYTPGVLACYQADGIFNMAASSNAEETQLQDMEEEDAGMAEKKMESDEEEEGMGIDNSDDEEDDSSEDEKENEAEIQRLEEQVISQQPEPSLVKLTLADELMRMNGW